MAKKIFVNFQFMIFYVSFNIEKCPENIDTFRMFLFGFQSRNRGARPELLYHQPPAAPGPSALASRRFVWFFKILFQVFYLISYFSRPYIFSTFFLEVIRPADPTFNDKSQRSRRYNFINKVCTPGYQHTALIRQKRYRIMVICCHQAKIWKNYQVQFKLQVEYFDNLRPVLAFYTSRTNNSYYIPDLSISYFYFIGKMTKIFSIKLHRFVEKLEGEKIARKRK